MVKIELTYAELVDIRYAIQQTLKSSREVIADDRFKKNYPSCHQSLVDEAARCESILAKLQDGLDQSMSV